MNVKLDLTEFNKLLETAANNTFESLGELFQEQLTGEVREFPRETVRRFGRGVTGRLAGSPRDVVDSKELVDSYSLEVDNGLYNITANYTWSCPHAIIVYLGWTTKLGLERPPYPWILQALKGIDIPSLFKEEWDALS